MTESEIIAKFLNCQVLAGGTYFYYEPGSISFDRNKHPFADYWDDLMWIIEAIEDKGFRVTISKTYCQIQGYEPYNSFSEEHPDRMYAAFGACMNFMKWFLAEESCSCCGSLRTMHSVGNRKMCCDCYVKEGNPPATWHPQCMKAYKELKK